MLIGNTTSFRITTFLPRFLVLTSTVSVHTVRWDVFNAVIFVCAKSAYLNYFLCIDTKQ